MCKDRHYNELLDSAFYSSPPQPPAAMRTSVLAATLGRPPAPSLVATKTTFPFCCLNTWQAVRNALLLLVSFNHTHVVDGFLLFSQVLVKGNRRQRHRWFCNMLALPRAPRESKSCIDGFSGVTKDLLFRRRALRSWKYRNETRKGWRPDGRQLMSEAGSDGSVSITFYSWYAILLRYTWVRNNVISPT